MDKDLTFINLYQQFEMHQDHYNWIDQGTLIVIRCVFGALISFVKSIKAVQA